MKETQVAPSPMELANANSSRCVAFIGPQCIASGDLKEVVRQTKISIDKGHNVLIFDDVTSEPIEIDFRGTIEQVLKKISPKEAGNPLPETVEKRKPGRPKLGVVPREVTLLPRHWDWLNKQPGGASVALRKLVEEARKSHAGADQIRENQESVYRFMTAMAGNFPNYEEALRDFYRKKYDHFFELIRPWPIDIFNHIKVLVDRVIKIEEHTSKR